MLPPPLELASALLLLSLHGCWGCLARSRMALADEEAGVLALGYFVLGSCSETLSAELNWVLGVCGAWMCCARQSCRPDS